METISEMTVAEVDRVRVTGDPGQVADDRPDPEVPERARRRRFTAQYKLDVVAEYDAAPAGEKGGAAPGGPVLQSRDRVAAGPRQRDPGRAGPAAGTAGC
jgi:hypothetical protein